MGAGYICQFGFPSPSLSHHRRLIRSRKVTRSLSPRAGARGGGSGSPWRRARGYCRSRPEGVRRAAPIARRPCRGCGGRGRGGCRCLRSFAPKFCFAVKRCRRREPPLPRSHLAPWFFFFVPPRPGGARGVNGPSVGARSLRQRCADCGREGITPRENFDLGSSLSAQKRLEKPLRPTPNRCEAAVRGGEKSGEKKNPTNFLQSILGANWSARSLSKSWVSLQR